jgi:hypothetical protein
MNREERNQFENLRGHLRELRRNRESLIGQIKGLTAKVMDLEAVASCAEDTRDRYEKALRKIVELGEDPASEPLDLMQAFKIADDALNQQ